MPAYAFNSEGDNLSCNLLFKIFSSIVMLRYSGAGAFSDLIFRSYCFVTGLYFIIHTLINLIKTP